MKSLLVFSFLLAGVLAGELIVYRCDSTNSNCGYGECRLGQCICYGAFVSTNTGPCNACPSGYRLVESDNKAGCVKEETNDPCANKDCGYPYGICRVKKDSSEAYCECIPNHKTDNQGRCLEECEEGYEAEDLRCSPTGDPCENDPCAEVKGDCVRTNSGYECYCEYGSDENGICKEQPSNERCQQDEDCGRGTCDTDGQNKFCACLEGYTHLYVKDAVTGTVKVTFCATCAEGYERVFEDGAFQCTKKDENRINPCDNPNTCFPGTCEPQYKQNGTKIDYRCRCPSNRASTSSDQKDCDNCAQGYKDGGVISTTSQATRCTECDDDYRRVEGYCVPDDSNPREECNAFCRNGECVPYNDGSRYACKCKPNWKDDERTGNPCSICRDPQGDPNDDCNVPSISKDDFDGANERCKQRDPYAIAVREKDGNFSCDCGRRYRKNPRTGLCDTCDEGYFNFPSCVPRCDLPCLNGRCVLRNGLAQCFCNVGYTGRYCQNATSEEEGECERKCDGPNEECVVFEFTDNEEGSQEQVVAMRKCRCKGNWEDYIDPKTGAIRRCSVCKRGYTGEDCDIPADVPKECNLGCPRGTTCRITYFNNTASQDCYCRDGTLYDPSRPCNRDRPTNPCEGVECPRNARCIPDSGRCRCFDGYQFHSNVDGTLECVPIRPREDCPMECPPRQRCVAVRDENSIEPQQIATCVCILTNAYKNENGECVCRPGFTGPYCQERERVDPCAGVECPRGSICRVTEEGTATCVCANGFNGKRCDENPCRDVRCPGRGEVCVNGNCVCPVGSKKDLRGDCVRERDPPVDKPVRECNAENPCRDLPSNRTNEVKINSNTSITVKQTVPDRDKDNDDVLDEIDTNLDALNDDDDKGGFRICVRRQVKRGSSKKEALRICLRWFKIFIRENGEDKNPIYLGSGDNYIRDFKYERREGISEKGEAYVDTVEGKDGGPSEIVLYLSEEEVQAGETAITPNLVKFAQRITYPPELYASSNSRVCFAFQLEADVAIRFVRESDDNETTHFTLYNTELEAEWIAVATLAFERNARCGGVDSVINYEFNFDNQTLIGCIAHDIPEECWIDPGVNQEEIPESNDSTETEEGTKTGQNTGEKSSDEGNTTEPDVDSASLILVSALTWVAMFFIM